MNSSPEIYLNTTPKKHMKSFIYQSKSLQKEKKSNKERVNLWYLFETYLFAMKYIVKKNKNKHTFGVIINVCT